MGGILLPASLVVFLLQLSTYWVPETIPDIAYGVSSTSLENSNHHHPIPLPVASSMVTSSSSLPPDSRGMKSYGNGTGGRWKVLI